MLAEPLGSGVPDDERLALVPVQDAMASRIGADLIKKVRGATGVN